MPHLVVAVIPASLIAHGATVSEIRTTTIDDLASVECFTLGATSDGSIAVQLGTAQRSIAIIVSDSATFVGAEVSVADETNCVVAIAADDRPIFGAVAAWSVDGTLLGTGYCLRSNDATHRVDVDLHIERGEDDLDVSTFGYFDPETAVVE